MSAELSSLSDVGFSAPCISSAPSLGGEIGSSFSFADTIPLSAPTSFSLDTIPSDFSFLDSRPMTVGDIGSVSPEVPQAFYNAFAEESVKEDLLTPPTYLETISEPINIVDIPIVEPQSINNEQEIYQPEPGVEVNSLGLVANGLESEIVSNEQVLSDYSLPTSAEELIPEIQEITDPMFVIPRVDTSTRGNLPNLWKIATSSATEVGTSRNDIMEAVNELATLAETPMTIALPEVSAEVAIAPEVITLEQLATPEVVQIEANSLEPEIRQSVTTYESLLKAGVEEVQAVELVKDALIQAGTKTEVVEQIMVLVQTKQQVKTESAQILKQVQNDKKAVKIEEKIEEVEEVEEPAYAKASAGEEDEEEKKKKRRFKFIKDKIALTHIFQAWKKAIWSAPINKEAGKDIIDSIDALVLMPTEVQNSGVKSGILPKFVLEWLNFGDGAYRTALAMAKDIGLRSRQNVLEKVFALHQKYYPVTIAEDGEEAAKSNVELVLTYKPNPIGNSRNLI